MPTIDDTDLQIIILLSSEASMGAVAKKAGMSLSNVSLRISNIEKITGHIILHRRGDFRLTEAGFRMLDFALKTRENYRSLKDGLDELKNNPKPLRIVSSPSLIKNDITATCEQVCVKYKNFAFEITSGSSSEIIDAIISNRADIGMLFGSHSITGLQFAKYKTERIVLLVPNWHQLSKRDAINFIELLPYPVIKISNPHQMADVISAAEKRDSIKLTSLISYPGLEEAAHATSTTMLGLTITIESVARGYSNLYGSAKIVYLRDTWAEDGDFYTCVRDIGTFPPPWIDFIRLLRRKNQPYQ